MAERIVVVPGVVIPASALAVQASRSSGPGGQNVNKVASKIELRVDLSRVEGLDPAARARLDAAVAGRRDASGFLLLRSQRTRDQHRNLEDAREKARAIVARALVPPAVRRPTRKTAASRERRLEAKRRDAARKGHRRRVSADD